jgi:2,3-bisphosphoglycerate-independent phosphoglycerate mutase
MVAHTGSIPATIKACETVDMCLSRIIAEVFRLNGTVFITADHGNAEELINPQTGGVDTEHSVHPVPFIAVAKKWEGKNITLAMGVLADVAPTILRTMHIEVPRSMTGRNLLENMIE